MVDDNKHSHRRFSPGDEALLVCRCHHKDSCCVAGKIGKVVTVVDYAEEVFPPQLQEFMDVFHDLLKILGTQPSSDPVAECDYLIAVDRSPALVRDYQLMPIGGYTEKTPEPTKPEVVH